MTQQKLPTQPTFRAASLIFAPQLHLRQVKKWLDPGWVGVGWTRRVVCGCGERFFTMIKPNEGREGQLQRLRLSYVTLSDKISRDVSGSARNYRLWTEWIKIVRQIIVSDAKSNAVYFRRTGGYRFCRYQCRLFFHRRCRKMKT